MTRPLSIEDMKAQRDSYQAPTQGSERALAKLAAKREPAFAAFDAVYSSYSAGQPLKSADIQVLGTMLTYVAKDVPVTGRRVMVRYNGQRDVEVDVAGRF